MKDTTKALIMGAITGCGAGTAVINGLLAFFLTLPKVPELTNSQMVISFFGTALGCGLICPFFAGIASKGVAGLNYGPKSEHIIARFLPNQVVLHAIITGILTALIVWGVPEVIAIALHVQITLPRIAWVIAVGAFSGVAATFAMYFGLIRVHYAKAGN